MAGDVGGRECEVCKSPHRASIDHELLQGGLSQNAIAKKYGLSRHTINRHHANGHVQKRTSALAAYPDDKNNPVTLAQKDLANSIASITERAEKIMREAEAQYERVKDGTDVKAITELLKLNLAALREIGNLAGAYPKAVAAPADNRQIHLHGLGTDELRALLKGLTDFGTA